MDIAVIIVSFLAFVASLMGLFIAFVRITGIYENNLLMALMKHWRDWISSIRGNSGKRNLRNMMPEASLIGAIGTSASAIGSLVALPGAALFGITRIIIDSLNQRPMKYWKKNDLIFTNKLLLLKSKKIRNQAAHLGLLESKKYSLNDIMRHEALFVLESEQASDEIKLDAEKIIEASLGKEQKLESVKTEEAARIIEFTIRHWKVLKDTHSGNILIGDKPFNIQDEEIVELEDLTTSDDTDKED